MAENVFEREARPVRQFLSEIDAHARGNERNLAERAGALLRAYEARLAEARVPSHAITPARLALAVLIDHSARSESRVGMSAWLAAAHVHLFDRREMSIDAIRRFRDTARSKGREYADLHVFLDRIVAELEGTRSSRASFSRAPAIYLSAAVIVLVLALASYAAFLDYRFHARLIATFEVEANEARSDDPAERLERLADLSEQLARAAASAPLTEIAIVPFWNSETKAEETYREEVAMLLPQAVSQAIGEALATEGGDLEQYDSLRAWSVLSGRTEWSPGYLAGWLEAREQTLGTASLTRHVAKLDGASPDLPPPDEELLAQAVDFAAAVPEEERAFLELTRLDELRALPSWNPVDEVAGLDEVLVRRSGLPLNKPIPAIYTEDGWRYAQDVGVGIAVQKARAEADLLFPSPVPRRNDAPDRILATLQNETLHHWKLWLADLRVRPFSDRESAILISGALSQRNSSLERLILEVWNEVGGRDRLRPHQLQLRIAAEFGPAIQYVEQGKVSELSDLFAALNVAVGSIEFNEDAGAERLMNVQELSRSVSALQAAPPLVSQIAEDVLAQTSAAHSSLLSNPLTRDWQQRVFPLCSRVVEGRYPFQDGNDTDISEFSELFGPNGALPRFVAGAEKYIDTTGDTWRWKPEARLSGVGQESARFLQAAMAVSAGFYGPDEVLGHEFDITALAERGEATIFVSGTGGPVRASGDKLRLAWPGRDPTLGAEVSFLQTAEAVRVTKSGSWGLFHLLDETRLRPREKGRRQLVDLRTESGRLFFEIAFESPLNPVSARRIADGLSCPPVL